MKVLVIGGNGFIGSHLVDSLVLAGYKVRVFDRGPELYRTPLVDVDYRLGDFGDGPSLAEALEGVDIVYHLVSTTVPSTSNLDPVADIQGNLINTVKLLQLMVQKGISRIVYLSSGGTVYGIPNIVPIPETHPLKPICSYGVIKVAIENYLFMYKSLYGIQPIVLRASNPYGERQGHAGVQGVIGTFLKKIKTDETIEIWGDGSIIRDFIHISDLIKLCILASTSNYCGILNAGSGIGHSIRDVLDVLSLASNRGIDPIYKQGRAYDLPSVVLDVSKAKNELNWQPELSLMEGVAKTWQWINEL
ncbi:MAG: NAD-dependent epimerase/dehydratase family protein [Methylococcaceae bacterium]|nr:NAD-dependent epimerase/dehydratase family protein [Methylococcaceae bacterium]